MGRIFKWGCGGLVVFIILIAIIAAVSGGGGSEQAGDSGSQQESGDSGGEQQQPANMGEAVSVGNTTWAVTQAEQTTQLSDPMGETIQGNFVRVSFEFTNDGSEAITLDSGMITLLDEQGNEYQVDTDNMMYVPMENSIFLEQVNPGVTNNGTAIFTVGPDAQPSELRLSEGMFGANTRQVNLDTLQSQ
jgi:hypothetical protein